MKGVLILATLGGLLGINPSSFGLPSGIHLLRARPNRLRRLKPAKDQTIKNTPTRGVFIIGDPRRIRTAVTAVKGRCPRPLDDRVLKKAGTFITYFIFFCKLFFIILCFLCFYRYSLWQNSSIPKDIKHLFSVFISQKT